MSLGYERYLEEHKQNVAKGFRWFQENLPEVIDNIRAMYNDIDLGHQICFAHDASKTDPEEYLAYDEYFYGGNRSHEVVQEFNKAWLRHIHHNPHHWQYWVLINDDPNEDTVVLEMPANYVLEMICDWWAFSWKSGNLFEIFKWYEEHKPYIKFGSVTRAFVEYILDLLREKLESETVEETDNE